jgi:hypothetical protein
MTLQNLLIGVGEKTTSLKLLDQIDKVEYRRITSAEDLEQIIRLRTKSYSRAAIYADKNRKMWDDWDLNPDIALFGMFRDDVLISTIRLHHVTPDNRSGNSLVFFPQVLHPLLDQGMSFIDPTRFAVDPDLESEGMVLAMFTLRLGGIASQHFGCNGGLSMIKEGHGAFYRRVFQSTQLAPLQKFDAFNAKYALHSCPVSMADVICERYPIFRSLAKERQMLFDHPALGQPRVLAVKPTARLALKQHQLRGIAEKSGTANNGPDGIAAYALG